MTKKALFSLRPPPPPHPHLFPPAALLQHPHALPPGPVLLHQELDQEGRKINRDYYHYIINKTKIADFDELMLL
jgi:hypothetical protein